MQSVIVHPVRSTQSQNPVAVDMPRFLSGKAAAASCITWTSEDTRVHVIPRSGQAACSQTRTAATTNSSQTRTAANTNTAAATPCTQLQQPLVLSLPPCFVFHHANAYEDGSRLVVDSIAYPRLPEIWPEGELQDGVRCGVMLAQQGVCACLIAFLCGVGHGVFAPAHSLTHYRQMQMLRFRVACTEANLTWVPVLAAYAACGMITWRWCR